MPGSLCTCSLGRSCRHGPARRRWQLPRLQHGKRGAGRSANMMVNSPLQHPRLLALPPCHYSRKLLAVISDDAQKHACMRPWRGPRHASAGRGVRMPHSRARATRGPRRCPRASGPQAAGPCRRRRQSACGTCAPEGMPGWTLPPRLLLLRPLPPEWQRRLECCRRAVRHSPTCVGDQRLVAPAAWAQCCMPPCRLSSATAPACKLCVQLPALRPHPDAAHARAPRSPSHSSAVCT